MGAQQVKERTSSTSTALGLGTSSIRHSRTKPRVPKDSRILGSNIFTEHSGKFMLNTLLASFHLTSSTTLIEPHLKQLSRTKKGKRMSSIFLWCCSIFFPSTISFIHSLFLPYTQKQTVNAIDSFKLNLTGYSALMPSSYQQQKCHLQQLHDI